MNNIPLVSVIIPFYNEKENQVRRAIDSILNQTYLYIEIVIVLDNPNNMLIDSIVNRYVETCNNINYLKNSENIGISGTRNIAISISNGKYIAYNDGDDYSHPTRIEKQVNFLEKHLDVDVCGAGLIWRDESNPNFSFRTLDKRPFEESIKFVCPVPNPTFITRKVNFYNFGIYNPNLRKSEDFDLMVRWFVKGAVFENINDYLVDYYRDMSGSNSRISEETWLGTKIRLKYRKVLKLNLSNYIKIFLYDIPFFILLPRFVVNKLVFLKNRLFQNYLNLATLMLVYSIKNWF